MNNIPLPPVPGPNTDPNRVPPPGPGRVPPPTPDPGPGRLPPDPNRTPSAPPIRPPDMGPPVGRTGGGGVPPPPVYRPPVPDPSGDPYGSDNWKSGMGPQPSSTGGQTSNPALQYKAAQKQAPGAPPIRPPSAPAPTSTGVDGTVNMGSGSTPDFMQKNAEQSRGNRRAGTNFGIREKMKSGGVSGYTAPGTPLTGSGNV